MYVEGLHILQASESVPLQEYKFPEQSALLLGREREEVQVELIHIYFEGLHFFAG
jgi:hypothetical protein